MAVAITGARTRITLPPPPLAKRGFLAAVNVVPVSGHELLGVEYESLACMNQMSEYTGAWCQTAIPSQCTDPGTPDPRKRFDNYAGTWIEGDPLVVYAGAACDIQSLDEREQRAKQALAYSESRFLDNILWAWLDGKVTATPIDGGSIECTLGMMEHDLALNYDAEGLIVLPIQAAATAFDAGVLFRDLDGSLRTGLGTPVAAVAAGGSAGTGVLGGFISGRMTLLQGPVRSFSTPPMQRADGTCAPARALAERVYVPLVECFIAQYQMTCCDCPGGTTP